MNGWQGVPGSVLVKGGKREVKGLQGVLDVPVTGGRREEKG